MPKLGNFNKQYGKTRAKYEVWEDGHGKWHSTLKFTTHGEDALECANDMAAALRDISREPPEHSNKCECLLCTEWKIHNAEERLENS